MEVCTKDLCLVHMVGGENDGSITSLLKKEVPNLPPSKRIHSSSGFIQNDGTRPTHKCQQNGELPLHTSREVLG